VKLPLSRLSCLCIDNVMYKYLQGYGAPSINVERKDRSGGGNYI
jgi:hypothetical protein